MINLQDLVDGMNARMLRERAATQMTLGMMIAVLEKMPPETEIDGLGKAISYRGYYSDLAFQPQAEKVKAGDLLAQCRDAMGQVFEGYKGGDYVMGALTPVWVADYGCCGRKIMAINPDGTLETADDE